MKEGFRSDVRNQKVKLTQCQLNDQRMWLIQNIEQDVVAVYLSLTGKKAEPDAALKVLKQLQKHTG